jgi:amidohydrolase
MACITTIYCQIEGDGSHGAEPYLGSDPISSLAALISDWQIAINRRIDSRESVVLSVGKVESGTAANVIPSKAILEATLRYLNPDLGKALETVIQDVARSVEVRFGTAIHLKIERMVPALVNDERVTSYVASGITDVTGPKGVLAAIPSLGGDDFSFYLESIPGCYFFVGERQANRPPYGWHDPRYDIDEKSIALAAAVLTMTGIRAGQGVQI